MRNRLELLNCKGRTVRLWLHSATEPIYGEVHDVRLFEEGPVILDIREFGSSHITSVRLVNIRDYEFSEGKNNNSKRPPHP
jgi:hypothetical protein